MAGIGWDTQSGVEAAAASGGNPYAAAALFVIGGVLGGMKEKRLKHQLKEKKRLYQAAISPKYLAQLTGQNIPLFRQQISHGGAAGIQSGIENNIAQRGQVGTGLGVSLKNMAQTAPEIAAFNSALAQASIQQQQKVAGLAGDLGIAQAKLNVPGGFTPGYGNALMGLYGAGSSIYGNYQAAKTGQATKDIYGGGNYGMAQVNPGDPGYNIDSTNSLFPSQKKYIGTGF